MAITIAQQKDGAVNGTSLPITFTNPTVNSNGIVVCVGGDVAVTSVTDDAGNTYTSRRSASFFGAAPTSIWDCTSISGNPTTVTVHWSGTHVLTARIYEVNGTLTAHAGNSGNANSSAAAPGAFTSTTADTIWFAVCRCGGSVSAAPSGWNLDTAANNTGIASKVFTTTQSSLNPTFTNGSGGNSACGEAYTSTNTGGTVLNKSASNTLTLTETQTTTNVLVRTVSESVTFSETQTKTINHSPVASNTLTLTETQTTANVLKLSVSNTLTLSEFQTIGNVLNLPVSQTVTFTESQTVVDTSGDRVSQTLTLSQSLTRNIVSNLSVSESLTLTEAQSTVNVIKREVDESLTLTYYLAKAIVVSASNTLTLVQVAPIAVQRTIYFIDNNIVQRTPIASSGSNTGTLTLTFSGATNLGDGIVLVVGNQGSGGTTITSITDDGSNTYTLVEDANNLGTPRTRIYAVTSAAPTSVITLHFSTTGNSIAAIAYECSGSITTDTGNITTDNNSPQPTGSITTATSTLVFSADTGNAPSAPTGWVDDGQAQGVRFIHNIYSSSQTVNPAFLAGGRYAAAIESFTTANRGGVHSLLTLTSTQTVTHVTKPFISQTIPLAQPNRIPINYSLVRSIHETLTFSESQTGVASKPVSNTLTFSETQTVQKIKTVTQTLGLDQSLSAQLVSNVQVFSLVGLFQTIHPGPDILHVNVTSNLTLVEHQTGVASKPVASHLTLTQTVLGVDSKAVKEFLELDQNVRFNRRSQVSAHNTLVPRQAIRLNISRPISAFNAFGFSGFQKAHKTLTASVSSTLALSGSSTLSRYAKSITQTLSLSQTVTPSRVTGKSVRSTLELNSVPFTNMNKVANISNTLVFLPTHSRFLQDLRFDLPNVQGFLNQAYTLLRGPDQIVVLPNPQFGDGLGNTGEFTLRYSINGRIYSYVKNNNTEKLNYAFWLSRRKCKELQRFLQKYQAQLVELQNWKGEVWKVYITNNPFEVSSVSQYTNGQPTNEERWDISLEFEGVRMN